jgi:L-lactate dehydrogenase complex protein LldG
VALHIALVTPEQFWTSWGGWLQAAPTPEAPGGQAWMAAASNLTLVTGPSRTGDIEMTLTVGVHGPRTVHVIVVG